MANGSRAMRIMFVTMTVALMVGFGVSWAAQRRPGGAGPGTGANPDAGAAAAKPSRTASGAVVRVGPDLWRTFQLPRSCELQIQQERWVDQIHYYYAPFVTWDWDKATGKIKFQILTRNDKTTTVVWQVSAAPFDNSRKTWETPTGLLASGKAQRSNGLNMIEIDFGLFAPQPPKAPTRAEAPPQEPLRRDARGRVAPRGTIRAAVPQRALKTPPPPPPQPKDVTLTPMAQGMRNLQLSGPTSFFVRALALDAQGNVIDYPALPVEVSWGPQKAGSVKFVAPPQPPPAVHPTITLVEYTPIHRPQNPYKMMCTQDLLGFKKGRVYDFTPRPDSGFEKFIDSWGGLFGFIVQVYSWVSESYNGLREGLLDVVAAAVSEINPELGKLARAAAAAALTTGMAALGIPPSLPSTDELASMGKDYLASTLADQVPGLPPEAARLAIDKLAGEMQKSYASGGGNKNVLFVPDPADRYRPGILWLEATNRGSEPTTPMDIAVELGTFTPSISTVAAITGVEYKDGFRPMALFKSRSLPLPSLAPGQTMRIPFAFEETYDELRDGFDAVRRACWQDGYCNHVQALSVTSTLPNPVKGGPANAKLQQALKWSPDKPWKP